MTVLIACRNKPLRALKVSSFKAASLNADVQAMAQNTSDRKTSTQIIRKSVKKDLVKRYQNTQINQKMGTKHAHQN